MAHLSKNLLIALGLALVLFVGYFVFIKSDPSDGVVLDQSQLSQEAELETQNLLATLNELKSFNVEGRIFTDPLFLSLKDFRVDLGTEPGGRANPFAQIK